MSKHKTIISNKLRSGYKKPVQARAAISALLADLPESTHLTAPQIYELARRSNLKTSLSNIYKTLESLKTEGAVISVPGQHGTRYEAIHAKHEHDHLICVGCGYTIEFTDDLVQGFGSVLSSKNHYRYQRSQFNIYGFCKECQSKNYQQTIRQALESLQALPEKASNIEYLLQVLLHQLEAYKVDQVSQSMDKLIQLVDDLSTDLHNCQKLF